jgi:DNA-binding GntR family transcriptional regulator
MKRSVDLQSDQAYAALLDALGRGRLRGSEFHAMPGLADILGFPLAATREAVKRAEDQSLLAILPKRGVVIMETGPATTRACMDMRAVLEAEGVRRLMAGGRPDLTHLRDAHRALLAEAKSRPGSDLSRRALATDLSLHDFMATGLDNVFLRQAYEANRHRIAIIQNVRSFLPDRVITAMEEHLAIIDAIDSASPLAAVAEIERHLHHTLRWWGVAVID